MLLPHIEQGALYNSIDFNVGTAVGANQTAIRQPIPFWRCPSDSGPSEILAFLSDNSTVPVATGNYAGVEPVLDEFSSTKFGDVIDGLSQTLFIGERVFQPSIAGGLEYTSSWAGQVATDTEMLNQSIPHVEATATSPINFSLNYPQCFSSRHTGGAQFTFGDGSTRLLSENMDADVFEALGTPAGGETVSF
jgi:prepilin-type processing-associated H-X9-DG protein